MVHKEIRGRFHNNVGQKTATVTGIHIDTTLQYVLRSYSATQNKAM